MPLSLPCLFVAAALTLASAVSANAQTGHADVTVVSVLATAKEEAERATTEEARIVLRRQVARFIRSTGQDAAFGRYAADAFSAWESLDRARFPNVDKRDAEARNTRRMAEAQRAFLDGDTPRAREILQGCEFVPHGYYCLSNEPFLQSLFLHWDLEATDFSAALRRYATTDWKSGEWQIAMAAKIAQAQAAAEQRSAGLAILRDLEAIPSASRFLLARELLKLGAADDGKRLLRDASIIAMEAADLDPRQPLPVDVARVQLASGNRDDAVETLRRLQRFAVPLEYELPPPRPPEIPSARWDPRANLTAAAARWIVPRSKLVETLAWAGLDSEAFAFLDEQPIDDALVLRSIVSGQARRGDFVSAFKTLERIRGSAVRVLQTWFRPLPDRLESTGANSYRLRDLSTYPVSGNAKEWSFYLAANSVAKYAAHFGNENLVRHACTLNREVNPHPSIRTCTINLRYLAKAGRVDAAMELVSSWREPAARVHGLGRIAEGMAGVPDPLDDDPL